MSVVGGQDFWVTGSRLYFQKDAVSAVVQPLLDLGTIQVANPSLEVEKIQLKDSDGGLKVLVDEAVTGLAESYDITCNNLNLDMLSLMFLAQSPEAFVQAAGAKTVVHWCTPGRLLKIVDNDAAATPVFSLSTIAGVYKGSMEARVITGIVASTKTITYSGGAFTTPPIANDKIIVKSTGLANVLNAGTYTVVSATSTTIVTSEAFAADEVAITGSVLAKLTGAGNVIYAPTTDWVAKSLDRGIIQFTPGGVNFTVAGNLTIEYGLAAIASSLRLIKPQSGAVIYGTAWIYWGRGNNAYQSVRECRISVTPNAANFSDSDFSNMVLTVTVVNDITKTVPAGRLLQFKGALPLTS
jgi:hypothetical protein